MNYHHMFFKEYPSDEVMEECGFKKRPGLYGWYFSNQDYQSYWMSKPIALAHANYSPMEDQPSTHQVDKSSPAYRFTCEQPTIPILPSCLPPQSTPNHKPPIKIIQSIKLKYQHQLSQSKVETNRNQRKDGSQFKQLRDLSELRQMKEQAMRNQIQSLQARMCGYFWNPMNTPLPPEVRSHRNVALALYKFKRSQLLANPNKKFPCYPIRKKVAARRIREGGRFISIQKAEEMLGVQKGIFGLEELKELMQKNFKRFSKQNQSSSSQ